MKLHAIDSVDIPFDKTWASIAIGLSGGADSALLSYLLCSLAPPNFKVHIISHIRCWKNKPWQKQDSINVYQWMVERFPNILFQRHTNFIAPDLEYGANGPIIKDEYDKMVSGDNAESRGFAEYICFHHNVDAFYNAVTRNPKGIDLGGMIERDLDPTLDNAHLTVMKHMDRWALHPLRFVDKSWVIRQYKNNFLEDLLSLTRSCEGTFKNFNYKNYTPGQRVPVCNTCFWCKERAWAIEQVK